MSRSSKSNKKEESGQVLVLFAFSLVVILGFSAAAIDIGVWLTTRTTLQADVDAMALAGAQVLCGTSTCDTAAITKANSYAAKNGLADAEIEFVRVTSNCTGSSTPNHDMVTVQATRHQGSLIAQLLGVTGADIKTCATAGKYALGGASGIRPFAMEDNCVDKVAYGGQVTIKFDSDTTRNCDSQNGNYGAIDIDGSGSSVYRDTIKYGSNNTLCTDINPGCGGAHQIDTETGNMIGPTKTGIDYLYANTPNTCNSWSEVASNGDLTKECTPWSPAYQGTSSRIIIIPVVDGLWDDGGDAKSGGSHKVTVKRFAILFLEGYDGGCSGNKCDITARFIKTTATLPGAKAIPLYNGADLTLAKIVQ